jgi:hypothetical protein
MRITSRDDTDYITAHPVDWVLYGSNDGGLTVTPLVTKVGDAPKGKGIWGDPHASNSSQEWTSFHLRVTKNAGEAYIIVSLELNTSAPKGDFYNVTEGIAYNSTDTPIKRVYLAKVDVDSNGGAVNIRNYPAAKSNVMDMTVHGLLEATENVKIVDFGVVNTGGHYVMDNPFGNSSYKGCTVRAEILVQGMWSETGWTDHNNLDTQGYGTKGFSNAEGLVVQTGTNSVIYGIARNVGSGFGSVVTGSLTSAPCRIIVTYHGRASNA